MYLTLNIGLAVAGATELLAEHVVLEILKANDFVIHKHAVVQSDSEATLVAAVFSPWAHLQTTEARLHHIAADLQQDCIAVWNQSRLAGALVGPQAAKWGEFNTEFFFTLDGKRLSEALARNRYV